MVSIAEITVFFPKMSQHQKQVKQGGGIVIVKNFLTQKTEYLRNIENVNNLKLRLNFLNNTGISLRSRGSR